MNIINKLLEKPKGYVFLRAKKFDKIIVLAPHCDDETIGCAGSILYYLSMCTEVIVVFLTMPVNKELADIRRQEAQNVWGEYKGVTLQFWEYPDGELVKHKEKGIKQLGALLTKFVPQMILLPWMIDGHEDHKSVFPLVCKAMDMTSIYCDLHFYEIFYPLIANHLINVTKYSQEKEEMLKKYESQLRLNFINTVMNLTKYRANCINLAKVQYAEAFFIVPKSRVKELINVVKGLNEVEYN